MTNEIFKDIPGYENRYQISNMGNIYSLIRNKLFKYCENGGGYIRVTLTKSGRGKTFSIHRLVMLTFIGPSNLEVNHKNGIKTDNRLENLEYMTASENSIHALNLGLRPSTKGSMNGHSKLTEDDILKIRELIYLKVDSRDIENKFNISKSTVYRISKKLAWNHVKGF